jgi:tetratricopeptide (TPR) repeat protein
MIRAAAMSAARRGETKVRFRSGIAIALLLAACAIGPAPMALAQQGCEIEQAQRLFGQQPRPNATIEPLLAACVAAGATDYRVYMFLGVMARDAGDRARAIDYLKKAHQLDPAAPNPALELAFTLEEKHGSEAAKVYDEVLARDPNNRPALLGQARIARGQYRLDEARAIYERLLAANPKDADALNGLAWLALAHRNRVQGRTGFEYVLTIDPTNEEAKVGLSKADSVYRYLFDADGGFVSTATGTSWGFGGRALLGVTPFDTLELGEFHFTNELQTLSAIGLATLPSDDIRLGWHRLVPLTYSASLVYDYRGHASLPTEHWIDGSVAFYITDYLRWFGGYRQAFGAFQWDGRLIRTGLSASLSPSWEVSATVYDAAQAIFNNYQDIWSWVFDVTYYGPRNMLVVAGVGYSPTINNVDLHARTILPLTDRIALQVAAGYNSINLDTRVTAGLRFTW